VKGSKITEKQAVAKKETIPVTGGGKIKEVEIVGKGLKFENYLGLFRAGGITPS